MKRLFVLLIPFFLFSQGVDFSEFGRVLKNYVDQNGFVDYQGILDNEKQTINKIAHQVAKISPKNRPELFSSDKEKLAYWINTYNLLIVKKIIENYPLESIKDIYLVGALVWTKGHDVGEDRLSFNNIEHDIIRKEFNEPRIHFAINCASYGCPILQNDIFTAENLEEKLQKGLVYFFNNERYIKFVDSEKTLYLSAILDWFKEDFYNEDKDETIFKYLIENAPNATLKKRFESIKDSYEVEYMEYDWRLNKK